MLIVASDPETFEWNHFDDAYRNRLDQRQYISPSRDRRQGQSEGKRDAIGSVATQANAGSTHKTTKETGKLFDDDEHLEFDETVSDEEDAEIPEGSLFDYEIPGVMTKDEVNLLNLENWRLVVRNALIELEVQISLFECVCKHVADRLVGPSGLGGLENRRPWLNQRHCCRAYCSFRPRVTPKQCLGSVLSQWYCDTGDTSEQTQLLRFRGT